MTELLERIKWVLIQHRGDDPGLLAKSIVSEIENTHSIIDPDYVDEVMLDACFTSLPEHYDPPDPKRRLWHGFKAKRRYTAMAKAAPRIVKKSSVQG